MRKKYKLMFLYVFIQVSTVICYSQNFECSMQSPSAVDYYDEIDNENSFGEGYIYLNPT